MFKNTESEDKKSMTALFYSRSKTKTTINKNDIDDVFQSIYTAIITHIQKYLGKVSYRKN